MKTRKIIADCDVKEFCLKLTFSVNDICFILSFGSKGLLSMLHLDVAFIYSSILSTFMKRTWSAF